MLPANFPHNKKRKQEEAVVRQAEYDKLTVQEKLDKLPAEPGAKKQRAKLTAQLRK